MQYYIVVSYQGQVEKAFLLSTIPPKAHSTELLQSKVMTPPVQNFYHIANEIPLK